MGFDGRVHGIEEGLRRRLRAFERFRQPVGDGQRAGGTEGAAFGEHLVDEIGGAVENAGRRGEALSHVEHSLDAHDALHPLEIVECRFELGDGVERRKAAGRVTLLSREILADLALEFEIAIDPWQLSRCVEHVAGDRPWHIIGNRPGGLGKDQAELFKSLFSCFACHHSHLGSFLSPPQHVAGERGS